MSATGSGGGAGSEELPAAEVVRNHRWRRFAALAGLSILLVLLVAIAAVWIARRPIASNILAREFERRDVQATYQLERVGLRTQVVRNLVIGDPRDPDLVARYAQIQLRPRWNGSIAVYRVVARGVRLEGRVVQGRVVWGELSKLMPPPSDKPFELPDIVVDVRDASISLQAPFGPVGLALEGAGNLSGGFQGRLSVASPQLVPGRCQVTQLRGLMNIEVLARRPHLVGPISAGRFNCPGSRFLIDRPMFNIDSRFSESFTEVDGRGQMVARSLTAGENGLAALVGNISFKGGAQDVRGQVDAAARASRLGPISAERTRVTGAYQLSSTGGTFGMLGRYEAQGSALADSMLAGIVGPLSATQGTPLGPVATAMARAFQATARDFDANGEIRVVNRPGGGGARVQTAEVRARNGARAELSGGSGVTYYWPAGRLRVDGLLTLAGGGLPTGQVLVRQAANSDAISGVARFQPYRAGPSRLAFAPIRFAATPAGATEFGTVVELDGPFPSGSVLGLRLPLSGRFGPNGALLVGRGCITASWQYFRYDALQLGPTRLPICPTGEAILVQRPGGSLRVAANINQPRLQGRIGSSPMTLAAANARFSEDRSFTLAALQARLGRPEAPIVIAAERLGGSLAGSTMSGTFAGGAATIGSVPVGVSDAQGRWRVAGGDLSLGGSITAFDRNENPRFYPLASDDFQLTMSDNAIRAGGTLRHPGSGARVTDVSIRHNLASGEGGVILDVPGIAFGEGLQPAELTRLTEGVIALVSGTVRGQGRINWSGGGQVSSTGEFSTANMDLAAPFGPVQGLTTTIRFTDLLGLETAPGQIAAVRAINPGILVENGTISYQLLSGQRVRILRGVWPFMGGTLILRETILNFARPVPKRLTFEVVGLDANTFIETLGFAGLDATGTFDGVLPMIFDDEGGRIVGGRLESRAPGGTLAYNGPKSENMGFAANFAFDALRSLRFRNMVIRLDGDLAGEFATRLTIDQIALGQTGTANLIRSFTRNLRFKFNITIRGPFRALIQMAKGMRDPTDVIAPVLPFPLDVPGITTETRRIERTTEEQPAPAGSPPAAAPPPTPSASGRRP
jgi:translocation and assembly module TamB